MPLIRSSKSRTRRVAALAATAAAVIALAACQSGATGSGSSGSTGGAADFKGKTITLIAPDSPGGSYDSYARLFAPYLGQELGATVNVENVAGAGTLQGSNQLAAASPNGLTIGMVNVGADIASKVENQPGQSFDLRTLSWIGQPAQIPNVLVTQPGSNVQSFSGLLQSSSPVNVLDIRNGIGDMLNRVIYGAFGVPHKLDTGFEATSALKQGFLAKDGQTILEAMSTLYPLISGSEAKPLLVIGSLGLSSYERAVTGVPTLQSELSQLPASKSAAVQEALALSNLSDDFAAPAGLPSADLTVLRQAFAKAAALPALRAQATKESLPLAWISGPAVSGQVDSALSASSTIAPYVK
ncbi:MAG TPA: tripartite tricarboxylate transporter substrate-binding protein [Trebonia sp.]|nr:tripartite tricarboxylate transporter substrate-binding protein [Trebonia sp.]